MTLYGLIGYPLTHSFSKKYFTEKFQREGIQDSKYELFEIRNAEELLSVIQNNPGLRGLNVTIPHKEAVIPYLNALDDAVRKIKAVNVIKIENGKLKGYNSDYHGFKKSLVNFLSEPFMFEISASPVMEVKMEVAALVLGTGGASKAVMAALEDLGIPYKTVSRNPSPGNFSYTDLKGRLRDFKLLINTTPLGMYPKTDTCPDIPYDEITDKHFLFDLVYNPEETLFMKKGLEKGARTKNGLEMLYLQAEKAWEIWNK